MGDRQQIEEMASTSTAVATISTQLQEECSEPVAVLTLRPTATRTHKRKKVLWSEDTVDNEHMNKKKSKCCCIYSKPRQFGESDSECSDDECEHCFGHVERRHTHAHHTHTQETPAEPPVAVSLPPGPGTAPPGPAPPDQAPPT